MVFHIFGLSGLEQTAFFHNLGQMKEALPLNSLFNYFETTPFVAEMERFACIRFSLAGDGKI